VITTFRTRSASAKWAVVKTKAVSAIAIVHPNCAAFSSAKSEYKLEMDRAKSLPIVRTISFATTFRTERTCDNASTGNAWVHVERIRNVVAINVICSFAQNQTIAELKQNGFSIHSETFKI
jgi:hypothetical protein